jgi:uncharacterized protein YcnI
MLSGWRFQVRKPEMLSGWRFQVRKPEMLSGWRFQVRKPEMLSGWRFQVRKPEMVSGWRFQVRKPEMCMCQVGDFRFANLKCPLTQWKHLRAKLKDNVFLATLNFLVAEPQDTWYNHKTAIF